MAKRLYVGGLSYGTTSGELEEAFGAIGPVKSAEVVTERETGRSRGFGFVEMENDADADAAVARLNGTELDGRAITVNEARERPPRSGGGGRGGGGGYGGGGRDRDRW
ncbi:MAG: RNA-binding protein [Armatimonadetes bacterium]|nr:RNA-binding protein [Armatimonadota bacterium]